MALTTVIDGKKVRLAECNKLETVNGIEAVDKNIDITAENIPAGETFGTDSINEVLQQQLRPISFDEFDNDPLEPGYYYIKELTWNFDGEAWNPPAAELHTHAPNYAGPLTHIAQQPNNMNALEIEIEKSGWYRISTLRSSGTLYYNIIISVRLPDNSLREIINHYHEKYAGTSNPVWCYIQPTFFRKGEKVHIQTTTHDPSTVWASEKRIER